MEALQFKLMKAEFACGHRRCMAKKNESEFSIGPGFIFSPSGRSIMYTLRRRYAIARALGRWAWDSTTLPDCLTEEAYREKIQPRLARLTVPAITAAIGVSKPYATDIRAGKRIPHPRHREKLAQLAGAF